MLRILHAVDRMTKWAGKNGPEGSWVNHFRIPFYKSVRVTAQLDWQAMKQLEWLFNLSLSVDAKSTALEKAAKHKKSSSFEAEPHDERLDDLCYVEVEDVGGVANDDDAGGVDNDRLAETEFVDALHHIGDRVVVDARIVFVRLDSIKRPHFDLHGRVLFQGE